MIKKKVISTKNRPRRMPIFETLLTWIALDYWNAAGWVWGAVGLLFVIIWSVFIYELIAYDEIQIDIFDEGQKKTTGLDK